jgi:quinol monooxygenase YgiN
MFVVRIDLKIRTEQRAAFRAYAGADGLRPRSFAGCVDYTFCEDLSEPTRVLLYEEWTTRDLFEVYKASDFFHATGARLREMLQEPPRSAYYESDDIFDSCVAE